MSLIANLKSFFGKKPDPAPPTWEMTEFAYAIWPIKLLADNEPPFDLPKNLGNRVSENLQQFWTGSLMQYQLFTFQVVNAATWGQDFALRILGIQEKWMNENDPGWGDNHSRGIAHIYGVLNRCIDEPQVVDSKNGEQLTVPVELRMAGDFLLTSPDSPHKLNINDPGEPSTIFPNDEHVKLATDLETVKEAAMEYFQRAAKIVRFVQSYESGHS
mgnify:CR=1 FL=1